MVYRILISLEANEPLKKKSMLKLSSQMRIVFFFHLGLFPDLFGIVSILSLYDKLLLGVGCLYSFSSSILFYILILLSLHLCTFEQKYYLSHMTKLTLHLDVILLGCILILFHLSSLNNCLSPQAF